MREAFRVREKRPPSNPFDAGRDSKVAGSKFEVEGAEP
jgi:hypothetical protein